MFPTAETKDQTYFAVRYKLRAETEPRAMFEVKQADKFPGLRTTWNNAALRAPETCSNDSANKGTGQGDGKGVKLLTNCGFWLSEIERGLVQNKFTVAQWNALRDLERTKAVPAYVAARDLGADVVFIINSLENDPVRLGSKGRESFDVFAADEDGRSHNKMSLPRHTFEDMRSFVKGRMKPLKSEFAEVTTHLTATLDITAVDTKTGEAVWFYRKQEVKPVTVKLDRFFLFSRDGDKIWPVQPHAAMLAERAEQNAARSSEESTDQETYWLDYKATPADAYAEEMQALSRAVVADFLNRFRGG